MAFLVNHAGGLCRYLVSDEPAPDRSVVYASWIAATLLPALVIVYAFKLKRTGVLR